MPLSQQEIERMKALNVEQAGYYDHFTQRNAITQLWTSLRNRFGNFRGQIGVKASVYNQHRAWLGDLYGKSVLDLGVGRGNALSIEIARQAKSYLAIDLSPEAIKVVRAKLDAANLPQARAMAIDFLSEDFTDTFDVVYAYGVMHHFRYFDAFLQVLASHLNPNGIVVSIDPLQTGFLNRALRTLYRPFQTDRDWEFPFRRETFMQIQKYFQIEAIQGVLGSAKWSLPLAIVAPKWGIAWGKRLHARDLQRATALNGALFSCMHVSLLLKKCE